MYITMLTPVIIGWWDHTWLKFFTMTTYSYCKRISFKNRENEIVVCVSREFTVTQINRTSVVYVGGERLQKTWTPISVAPTAHCVALGKSQALFGPQSSIWEVPRTVVS